MPSLKVRVAAAVALAIALPFSATACGGGGGGGGGGGDTIVIGTKFDQPGLGLKNPDGTMSGFDVDVATYVAKAARLQRGQDRVEGITVRAARDADPERSGQVHRRHLLDHRCPQGEGRLRRAVPGHRAEPAGEGGQHRHHRRGVAAEQQEAVLGVGFDAGAAHQGQVPRRAAAAVRHLLGLRRGAEERRDRRGDHRRGDPRRLRRAEPRRRSRSSASRSPRSTTASA